MLSEEYCKVTRSDKRCRQLILLVWTLEGHMSTRSAVKNQANHTENKHPKKEDSTKQKLSHIYIGPHEEVSTVICWGIYGYHPEICTISTSHFFVGSQVVTSQIEGESSVKCAGPDRTKVGSSWTRDPGCWVLRDTTGKYVRECKRWLSVCVHSKLSPHSILDFVTISEDYGGYVCSTWETSVQIESDKDERVHMPVWCVRNFRVCVISGSE